MITLGVIGVVAAMTIPVLVGNYKTQQRVTQLKKTVSTINQAYQRVMEDYGSIDTWGINNTNTGTKDVDGNTILDYSGSRLLVERLTKYLANTKLLEAGDEISELTYSLDGRVAFEPWVIESGNKAIQMPDGTIFLLGWFTNCNQFNIACSDAWIIFPKKHSTTIGIDVFDIKFNSAKGLFPEEYNVMTGNLNSASNYCSKFTQIGQAHTNGRGCAAWVLFMGNMDYLNCDDLNWETKHKCR